MKIQINPFADANPMSLKDAAIVASIAAFAIWVLQFFANAQYNIIVSDPGLWCFEAIKNYVVNWAGTFVSLAGLEQLISRSKEKTPSGAT
jgi:hypothetical protein